VAKIEGFRVINYRSLRDVTMGKLWNTQNAKPLTPNFVDLSKDGISAISHQTLPVAYLWLGHKTI
jgi:hypothetical protein